MANDIRVHCKTQEEWDEVSKICGYKWQFANWSHSKEQSYINTTYKGYQSLKSAIYPVISFQEFLKLKNINAMKYKEGDIIINKRGSKREILGVCGKVYFPSLEDLFEQVGACRTQTELDNEWYVLFEEPTVIELTLEDIAKKFEVSVETLKIKK